MKRMELKSCDEIIAFRVETSDSKWQESKNQQEIAKEHKLNERMDAWLKQLDQEQRDGIEECIDDMLEENWAVQMYLYEEGVKDGIRLMKMIHSF